jgi:hypothetical protein
VTFLVYHKTALAAYSTEGRLETYCLMKLPERNFGMSKETNRNALAAYSTTEQVSPLATFYKPGWEHYQQALVQTFAPLSSEQLALSVGPHQRSIGELLEHMIGARFNWFHLWMGEGDPNLDWNDDEDNDEPTAYKAASLVAMFEKW